MGLPASTTLPSMDYAEIFARALQALKDEGRYRVFADIRRDRGRFPAAHHHSGGVTRPITVWCRPALGSASLRRARS